VPAFTVNKTFWPTLGKNWMSICQFIIKHRTTLSNIVVTVSPTDVVAVNAAFDAIITSCNLITSVLAKVEKYDN
jgi:hypothetical protein